MIIKSSFKALASTFAGVATAQWLGNLLFPGQQQAVTELAAGLGIGQIALQGIGTSVMACLTGKLGNDFGRFSDALSSDVNHDLEAVMVNAYSKSIRSLAESYLKSNDISDPLLQSDIDNFADSLWRTLTSDKALENQLEENAQLNPEQLLSNVFDSGIAGWPRKHDQDKVRSHFISHFPQLFRHHFIAGLKYDDKAKTAYFSHLLENITVLSQNISEEIPGLTRICNQISIDLPAIIQRSAEVSNENFAALNAQLGKVQGDIVSLRQTIERYHEPVLYNNIVSTPALSSIFDYKTQYTSFLGRNVEKSQLWDFVDAPQLFSWLLLTGPGGIGKSRLAQEMCSLLETANYHAGFLDVESYVKGEAARWHLSKPTFIVIDYAFAARQIVLEIIRSLTMKARQKVSFEYPIRLLLLERESNEQWKETTKDTIIQSSAYTIGGQIKELVLTSLDDEHLWDIIEQMHSRTGKFLDQRKKKRSSTSSLN